MYINTILTGVWRVYFYVSQGVHQLIDPYRRIFTCDICGQSCRTKKGFNRHRGRHEGKHLTFCSICGRGCSSRNQLIGHMVTHTGKRQFKCPDCDKEFIYKYQLTEHFSKRKCPARKNYNPWMDNELNLMYDEFTTNPYA